MSSDKRLVPGFRQVDTFDSDECYERDEQGRVIEEISYVTLDLGAVEPTLVPSSSTYRLIVRGRLLIHPSRLTPCRAWIRQARSSSSLAQFFRVHTSHSSALSSSSPRKKVLSHLIHVSVSLIPTISDLHDQARRKVSHLANTSQRIRFKQVEVQPKDAPPEQPPGHSKSKGASSKQKLNTVSDDNIVDLITGNVEPGDLPPQRRRGGKGKGKRGSGSQLSQSRSGHVEQGATPEETPSAPGAAMDP
jgi:hypothetical protein